MLLIPEKKNVQKSVLLKIKINKWKLRLTNNKLLCKIIKLKKNKLHNNSYDTNQNSYDKRILTTKNNFKININSKSVNKLITILSPHDNFYKNNPDFEENEKASLKNNSDLYIQFVSFIKNNAQGTKIPTARELESMFDLSERKRRALMEKMEREKLIERQGKIYKIIS
ncbi:MAG: hypothetical protein ABF289_12185 [Clostridiales bacterium]